MAGDWIKMRADLFTHPKVVRISSALKADTLRTVGGLMSVWCLFDAHSEDGELASYTPEILDIHLRWPGFAEQMIAVGWLLSDEKSLRLPRFDVHNGRSAKRRAQDSERKKDVRKMSALEADEMRTREEKNIYNPIVPSGREKKSRTKLPEAFSLTDQLREAANSYWRGIGRPDLSADREFEKFVAHHRSTGKRMECWSSAWRTWYSNAPEFNKQRPVNQAGRAAV